MVASEPWPVNYAAEPLLHRLHDDCTTVTGVAGVPAVLHPGDHQLDQASSSPTAQAAQRVTAADHGQRLLRDRNWYPEQPEHLEWPDQFQIALPANQRQLRLACAPTRRTPSSAARSRLGRLDSPASASIRARHLPGYSTAGNVPSTTAPSYFDGDIFDPIGTIHSGLRATASTSRRRRHARGPQRETCSTPRSTGHRRWPGGSRSFRQRHQRHRHRWIQ